MIDWWPLMRPAIIGFVVAFLSATWISRAILKTNAQLRRDLKEARSMVAWLTSGAADEDKAVEHLKTVRAALNAGRAEGFADGWRACETANGVKPL